MSPGLIYSIGVLCGGVGIALLLELLALTDDQAPCVSRLSRRLGASSRAINPEAQGTRCQRPSSRQESESSRDTYRPNTEKPAGGDGNHPARRYPR